ncbi:GAF and ANTAR domain-containing protein [Actinomadura gamaensis]|uniref:GAF and ANTAR domain-containing protein n=1 Tax=Actinomadura gamaensis TaxID=1763541 RepID=A0ABV9TS67_9ACTN
MATEQITREQRLTRAFVDLADTLVDDFEIIDYLTRLTVHAMDLLTVAAAGVLLTNRRGRLQLVAASTERVRMLELLQLQQDQGPCLDTFTTGRPVSGPDLTAAGKRWPAFAPAARQAGYSAAHGLPLRLRDDVLGTLNLFTHHTGDLPPGERRLGQALADHATIGLLGHHAAHQDGTLTRELHIAVHSRILIEQAKGVLAERRGLSVDDAAGEMRAYAGRHHRKLSDIALALIHDSPDVRALANGSGAHRS